LKKTGRLPYGEREDPFVKRMDSAEKRYGPSHIREDAEPYHEERVERVPPPPNGGVQGRAP
jgi:hypothetical protein